MSFPCLQILFLQNLKWIDRSVIKYEEEIGIRSTRGLDINHPEDVKIILSQVNYLTSPNGYKTLFLDNTFSNEEEDVYKAGCRFEEIYAFMK